MTARLRIQDGLQQREVVLPRTSQPIRLGRANDNDIVLYAPVVSAYHAQLIPAADGTYQIVDCASMNGLLFGGQRLEQAHTLADGDTLRIGDPRLGSLVSLTYCNPHHARATPVAGGRVSLDAAQVSYQIGRGGTARTLLHPTTLSLASGMLVAIIGASGAGKSTLLKALCGYQPATAGRVLLNGHDLYANLSRYRSYLGYVPQADTLHGSLTVGQALHFTACLRLPDQTTAAEREARITRALTTVDLLECRHQRIAELSGGQRKRAAIAAELLIEPALLFLDEPASGLDPGLEQSLMYTLRQIADAGCGVVLVTHATENIMQCDQVVLLAQGYPVYCGAPADALSYFELDSLIFADVYSRVEGNIAPEEAMHNTRLKAGYAAWQQAHPNQPAAPAAVLWAHALQQAAAPMPAPLPAPLAVPPHTSWWQQARTLIQRVALLKWQDRRYFWLLVLQAPLIGLVVRWLTPPDALLGTQVAGLTQRGEARELLFTLVLVGIWGGLLNAAREFASNPAILRHDRFNGVRASAAFAARFVLLASLALLQVGMLLGMVLSGVPLPPDAGLVLPLALEVGVTLLLASLAATALGLAVSASAAGVERAISSVPLLLVIQIIFAGMIFPATDGVAAWLSQVTISRPAVDALGASLDLNTFCDLPNDVTALGGRPPVACSVGTLRWRPDPAFADAFTPTADHLLHNWLVLGVLLGLGVLATMLLLWQQYIVRRIPVRRRAPATASLVQLAADDTQPEQPESEPVADVTLPQFANDTTTQPELLPPEHTILMPSQPFVHERESTVPVGNAPPHEVSTVRSDQADTMTHTIAGDTVPTLDMGDEPALASGQAGDGQSPTQMISRYQVMQNLGSRGIFTVYRAYDPVMRRQVAIKVLQQQYCSPLFNARFRQEVGLLAALEHPAIVPVYDYGEIDTQPFMVMQFIDAGSLATRMSGGTLPVQELVPVVDRVAAALDTAHARNIVHQSLKPANILFNTGGQAFLSDFGIHMTADMISDLSQHGVFDANYLSPEQISLIQAMTRQGSDLPLDIPPSSDIYALAAVVFHALTGQPLFPHTSPAQTLAAHLTQPVPDIRERNRQLPVGCQQVFATALAKEPSERYPTASAFAYDLREMARGRWFLSRLAPSEHEARLPLTTATPPSSEVSDSEPPPAPDSPRIGRYLLERPVGQGGMATVYLAYDPLTERRVAIKVLTGQLTGVPAFSVRFRKEAEMVAALEHESIIRVYDLGEHAEQPFIVMQYLPGGTLASRLRGRRMTANEFLPIMERLVAGLQVAHERRIIHQDIKPSNILFNRDGAAVLSDFGIAAVVEASTRRSRRRAFGGTPRYMSPEQAQLLITPNVPALPISPQSDIYSLGVVLFQALAGRVPYEGHSVAEIALAHLHDPIPSIRGYNPQLPTVAQDVLARALAKDPAERYANVEEFMLAVRALADGSWALKRI